MAYVLKELEEHMCSAAGSPTSVSGILGGSCGLSSPTLGDGGFQLWLFQVLSDVTLNIL